MNNNKINLPISGAGRRLADRLEKLGQQRPPQTLIDKIKKEENKKVASSAQTQTADL